MVFTSLSPMKKAIPFEHYTHPEGINSLRLRGQGINLLVRKVKM
jgi:hypothetical protein